MNFKKILLCAVLSCACTVSFMSCSDKDKKDEDSFSIVPADTSATDPFDNSQSISELPDSSFSHVVVTTVYEDMESAYMSMVNGDESKWEEYRDHMYNLLTGIGCEATDTDGDGFPDDYELEYTLTDPELADTDGDGYDDCVESWMHTDPNTYND